MKTYIKSWNNFITSSNRKINESSRHNSHFVVNKSDLEKSGSIWDNMWDMKFKHEMCVFVDDITPKDIQIKTEISFRCYSEGMTYTLSCNINDIESVSAVSDTESRIKVNGLWRVINHPIFEVIQAVGRKLKIESVEFK